VSEDATVVIDHIIRIDPCTLALPEMPDMRLTQSRLFCNRSQITGRSDAIVDDRADTKILDEPPVVPAPG
jgi:hypothetical protein